jgi:hypothetical protein
MFPKTQQPKQSFISDSIEATCKITVLLSYCCQTLEARFPLILKLAVNSKYH